MGIRETLGKELLFFDGALGTMLQAAGLRTGEPPELWNLSRPADVRAIHDAYLAAGAQVIEANTFGANRLKLAGSGRSPTEVIAAGADLAREAVAAAGRGFVSLDVGSTGKLLQPLGTLPFEEAVEIFREMVLAGVQAGVDCVHIETMTDLYEAKAAVLAAKENCDLPVFVTMTFDEGGKLLTGGDLSVMAAVLEGLGVDALGVNCGLGPQQMVALTKELRAMTSLPILIIPNAGLPRQENGQTVYDVEPRPFAEIMVEVVAAGASGVGGCCGTTPAHIAQLVQRCQGLPCPEPSKTERSVITSGSRSVVLGNGSTPPGKPGSSRPCGSGISPTCSTKASPSRTLGPMCWT